MKNLAVLITALMTMPGVGHATVEVGLQQKVEMSAQCKSAFGNAFCSGESACREVAEVDAKVKNCKSDIKKIDFAQQEDYISEGITYRSYNCKIEQEATCTK